MKAFKRYPDLIYPEKLSGKITLPKDYDERYPCQVTKPAESNLVESFIERGYTFNVGEYNAYGPDDNMNDNLIRMLTNYILAISGVDSRFFRFIAVTRNVFGSLESIIGYYQPKLRIKLLTKTYPKEDFIAHELQNYMLKRYPEMVPSEENTDKIILRH